MWPAPLAPPLPSPLPVRRREGNETRWLGPNLRNPSSSPRSLGLSPGPDAGPGARTQGHAPRKPKVSGVGAKEAGTKLPRTGGLAPAGDGRSGRMWRHARTSGGGEPACEAGLKKGEARRAAHCCLGGAQRRLVGRACG